MTRKRHGYSLVEMLVVMTCASTVLSLSTLLIHRSMRAHSKASAIQDDERSAWRLSSQLRRDASEASSATAGSSPEGPLLLLSTPVGETIRYRFEASAVVRLRPTGDAREARETFDFQGVDRWVVEALERPDRIAVSCAASASAPRNGVPLRFDVRMRVPAVSTSAIIEAAEGTP